MSNNCLVTKLKGSAQNDNLPILGKIIIEIPQIEQTPTNGYLYLGSAPDASVDVRLVNSTFIDGLATEGNHVVLTPNVLKGGHITVTNNNQRVVIDAYNIRTIQQQSITNIIGIEALNYGVPKRITFGFSFFDSATLRKLHNIEFFGNASNYNDDDIAVFLENNKNTLVYIAKRITSSAVNATPSLTWVEIRDSAIDDLPVRLNGINVGPNCTGSVNTLIDNWRNAGRTSGKIQMSWLTNSATTTIDTGGGSVSTKQWGIDHNITAGLNVYLSWDADTLTITNDGTGAPQQPMMNNFVV